MATAHDGAGRHRTEEDAGPVLTVENLKTYYMSNDSVVPAVDGVDFELGRGEMLGIVGESGCGKSTLARSLINLVDHSYTRIVSGQVRFDGLNILDLPDRKLRDIRGRKISMIFQNPQTALNPVYVVGNQIGEVLRAHGELSRAQVRERTLELLHQVGIPAPHQRINEYPHQLSGGMQQRISIAIALACRPDVVIADEPTTALDVTIQAQILELVREINATNGTALVLVSHNLGVIAQMCTRTLVMYGGVIVEESTTKELFARPAHPYTRGLLNSIPQVGVERDELEAIPGVVPRLTDPVTHCRFADRCPAVFDKCRRAEPPMITLDTGHRARCWLYEGRPEGDADG